MEQLEQLIVKKVFDEVAVSEKMSKVEVLFIRDMGRLSQEVLIQFVNNKIDLTRGMDPGDVYNIGYDAISRASKNDPNRYFTSCDGWKAELVKKNQVYQNSSMRQAGAQQFPGMGFDRNAKPAPAPFPESAPFPGSEDLPF